MTKRTASRCRLDSKMAKWAKGRTSYGTRDLVAHLYTAVRPLTMMMGSYWYTKRCDGLWYDASALVHTTRGRKCKRCLRTRGKR